MTISGRLAFVLLLSAVCLAGHRTQASDASEPSTEDLCPASAETLLPRFRPLRPARPGSDEPAAYRPLNRQAVLFGPTRIDVSVSPECTRRLALHRFAVAVGAVPLCRVDRIEESCVIDFGTDLDSWILSISASVVDLRSGKASDLDSTIDTLDAALDDGVLRIATAGDRVVREERTEAQGVPDDEITRIAMVLDRDGSPLQNLGLDDFDVNVSGVRGERLVSVTPMRSVVEPRLLFVLIDVADFIRETRSGPAWKTKYRSFVGELVQSLETVSAPDRKLLVVRYSSSGDASPIVDLAEGGLANIEIWLLRPPLDTWHSGRADRSSALLQAYDKVLHDFRGQSLGVIISGGRDTGAFAPLTLSEERVREINSPWPEKKTSDLLADLDQDRIDLFPHTEQRGFPLSWIYVPSGNELTTRKFQEAADYFRRFGGEVYRRASIRDLDEESGHRTGGGSLFIDDVLLRLFEDLEHAYRLRIRIPNPRQKRVDRQILVRVAGGTVRTQTFFRPSSSLRDNVERYLNSISQERRMRAAYAARNYPLDDRIYRKVGEWRPEEASIPVRRILEESRLLMEFKRGQSRHRYQRIRAFEELHATPPDEVDEANRQLLENLVELVALIITNRPDAYGGEERIRRILRSVGERPGIPVPDE